MADRWDAGEAAARDACELVEHVRDNLPAAHRHLARLAREGRLEAVTVALAAMVPDDVPPTELLAWTDPLAPEPSARQVYDADVTGAGAPNGAGRPVRVDTRLVH